MKKIKVAINGLGRIGRAFLKLAITHPEIEVVAVNDLGEINNFAYLLRYDSAYGRSGLRISTNKSSDQNQELIINDRPVKFFSEKDPSKLPWGSLGIDVVVESTGVFETYEKAKFHLDAGARKVVVSAPIKGTPTPGITGGMVLMGINDELLERCQITSNASCTTNAAGPVIKILHETIGIEKALLNTVHAYTATQKLVDSPDTKDFRRGRAGAQNIVPSTTGAAVAVTEVITDLKGKFDGIALRVPVVTGSVADITFIAKRPTTAEEVNSILKTAAADPKWQTILEYSEEPLVSTDIISNPHASIVDSEFTTVVGGNLVKVLAWYDNEMGYTNTLIQHVIKLGSVA
jgi:glyceraldehyde 3-phosphate dehydrogenase